MLSKSFSALWDHAGVMSMLRRRCSDDKINVRKAALQVLEKIIKLEGDNFTWQVYFMRIFNGLACALIWCDFFLYCFLVAHQISDFFMAYNS